MFQTKFLYAFKVKANGTDNHVGSGRGDIDCDEGVVRIDTLPALLTFARF
jgi:hypothetical protein